jgi:hypothetical protein
MTSYNLSSFAGAGAQFFDDNGNPLTGGKVYTYAAGTTTPLATYTTSAGTVANTNPIILDAAGRTANETWLVAGTLYKFIVKTSADVLVGTYDGLPAINDPYSINSLLGSVTGTNAIAAVATPSITAYAAGATYAFIAANTNTAAATLSIDGLPAKSITANGSATLTAGDIQIGKLTWVQYDGTTFQLINNIIYGGSITNGTIVSLSTPLGAASGGTGLSTITANSVMLGNGISTVQTVAPSTSGNVLTSNGTTWSSARSLIPTMQVFTATGTSTFTIPASVTKVKVTVIGGGGGGRSSSNSTAQGGGGAGGAAIKVITGLTPGGTVTVTVGAGGAANTSGDTSSFGAYCSATGGSSPGTGVGGPGPGGAGGTATGGDINFTGGGGCGGNGVSGTTAGTTGNGGSSIFGGAGLGITTVNTPSTAGAGASGTGAGGAGGAGGPGTAGAGGSGIVIVEY